MDSQKSIKQSIFVSFGTGINSLLGLFFYLTVIQSLTVGAFGEYTFLLVLGTLAYELGDLGINSSILKFSQGEDISKTTTLALYERLAVGGLIFLLAAAAQLVLGQQFLVSACLAFSLLLFSIVNQTFLANERFLSSVAYNISANLLRLALIIGLVFVGGVTVTSALSVAIIGYLVIFTIGLLVLTMKLRVRFLKFQDAKDHIPKVFHFSSWLGGSQAISALSAKIGSPILFALSGPVQTGLFGSAQTISGTISQFVGVLDSVFAPKFAKSRDHNHFKTYFLLALSASVLIMLSIPFARLFITYVFPPDYHFAIPTLEILLFGYAIFFLSTPFSTSTLYTFGKSKIHLSNSAVQLIATLVLYIFLLPPLGAVGAALTFVSVNLLSLVLFVTSHLILSKRS